jgi:Pentapeptide repeats (9 copies)
MVAIDWPTCTDDGCIGIRLDAGGRCLAHAPDQERDAALKVLSETGAIDARGVVISSALLEKILGAVPRQADGHALFAEVRFEQAAFQGDAAFAKAEFQGEAWFTSAIFQGSIALDNATFHSVALFHGVTFQGEASFTAAKFHDNTWFAVATFQATAAFIGVTVEGDAHFAAATFQGNARFDGVTVRGNATFFHAIFHRDADFGAAIFSDDAKFCEAVFHKAQEFGRISSHGELNLDGVLFADPLQIKVTAPRLLCRRARFPGVSSSDCAGHVFYWTTLTSRLRPVLLGFRVMLPIIQLRWSKVS